MNSLTLALDFPKYIQIFICHACHSELLNRFCELILTLTFSGFESKNLICKNHENIGSREQVQRQDILGDRAI
jgi:hypothetical protein